METPIHLGRIGAYSVLSGTFLALFGGFLGWQRRRGGELPERIDVGDIALVGIATHKLSQIVSRDHVTSPLRAPFTENEGEPPPGSKRPVPRGQGLRRAIGELITCPYCTGVWIAAGLTYGVVAAPRETRLLASIFASVSLADFLHRGYRTLSNISLTTAPRADSSRSVTLSSSATSPAAARA
jgi:hypothetical protein